ncbi:sarcosine oxidase subunit gamma [Novosphingobium sp. FKTRR1]|uniref:sarcosine oxidase subunit gamma n=1 Tax=Novosphingobium sp. FKTRR1 TaxID=2879118 RepID=UPI001CEFE036|nr:sarcosine oxidase gamma subunit [Novosphingobium sp. FKTRR1]
MPDAATPDIAPLAVTAADLHLPTQPFSAAGLHLELVPAQARYSLRARDAGLLAATIGRALPDRIGDTLDGVIKLGPDEWLALLPAGATLPLGEGLPVSVVDVSARAVGFTITGPGAAALIATGCPLDVERMAPGRATRTLFETVEIVLWRQSETAFRVDCWRSFAPWLWAALVAGAQG